jgi:hypothetical protein
MTVETAISDALKVLVSNRCYPDAAPPGAALPYITFQQVGGEAVTFLESSLPSKKNGRFQINCWAATRLASAALAREAEAAMVAATAFQAQPLVDVITQFNDDLNRYGSIQDFSVWSDR